LRERLAALPACAMILSIAWTTGTSAARRCVERAAHSRARIAAVLVTFASVTAYLVCVTGLDAWLGTELPHVTFAPVATIVAILMVAAGLCEGLGVRPPVPDLLYTLALTEGRAPRMEPA
jgi:hypothetical protein